MTRLLVILQNAWGVPYGYIPDYARASFRNSQTGKRLFEAIPEGVAIYIRNASPLVGDVSSANFPPDKDYVQNEIAAIAPHVILACGVNAKKVIAEIKPVVPVVTMPHPAYRALSKSMTAEAKQKIEQALMV